MTDSIPAEARELLTAEPLVAHLGTAHENRPHVAPLWFDVHDDEIEIATTGRKLANLRRNPKVALSVQKAEDGHPQWGVTLQGTASVIDEEAESEAALHRINRRYGTDEDAWSENTPVRISVSTVEYWVY